ncbi:MAG: hypothetical protein CfP315_0600 [Candidatus Improbicoccus pseudotrichonymphae]|uniref:Uncharacterized protein n=1 Tax=Candidatus Improbicoccus pseudotrichonymphae TaxID=3033792 RepID=A0AA48I1G5_9FIRM|nr:MAG: hypothetical protein CfP315_0600 [Candidatus Improbicoccus pseudotrichonymphae]
MLDNLTYLETKTEKYPMAFTLNVMESIQNEYGTLNNWSKLLQDEKEPNIKALKFFILEAIKEGIEIENKDTKPPNMKEVGRILTEVGTQKSAETIKNLIVNSTKTSENSESEQDLKNEKTTQI